MDRTTFHQPTKWLIIGDTATLLNIQPKKYLVNLCKVFQNNCSFKAAFNWELPNNVNITLLHSKNVFLNDICCSHIQLYVDITNVEQCFTK